ncbi:hypothetical protein A2U01_0070832, partial [Trifolium medium]|nr:hypothetical protein [Trifolium medium]
SSARLKPKRLPHIVGTTTAVMTNGNHDESNNDDDNNDGSDNDLSGRCSGRIFVTTCLQRHVCY